MKIAVASQNRKTVTGHAGKCRRFWIYDIASGRAGARVLLELPREQSLHAGGHDAPHPLDGVDALICAGLGEGLLARLRRRGIHAVATPESDPDRAVAAWLAGTLEELPAHAQGHDHAHGHGHHHEPTIPAGPALTVVSVEQLFSNQFQEPQR